MKERTPKYKVGSFLRSIGNINKNMIFFIVRYNGFYTYTLRCFSFNDELDDDEWRWSENDMRSLEVIVD